MTGPHGRRPSRSVETLDDPAARGDGAGFPSRVSTKRSNIFGWAKRRHEPLSPGEAHDGVPNDNGAKKLA